MTQLVTILKGMVVDNPVCVVVPAKWSGTVALLFSVDRGTPKGVRVEKTVARDERTPLG